MSEGPRGHEQGVGDMRYTHHFAQFVAGRVGRDIVMMPLQEIVWVSSFNRVRTHEVAERKYKNSCNRRQAGAGVKTARKRDGPHRGTGSLRASGWVWGCGWWVQGRDAGTDLMFAFFLVL